jgi:hypothetical protein
MHRLEFFYTEVTITTDGYEPVTLKTHGPDRGKFTYQGSSFAFEPRGSWKSSLVLMKDGQEIAALSSRLFSASAELQFADGALYKCVVDNAPLVRLTISESTLGEILSLHLEVKKSPRTQLVVHQRVEAPHDLMLLLAFGAFAFASIVLENEVAHPVVVNAA